MARVLILTVSLTAGNQQGCKFVISQQWLVGVECYEC